MMTTQEILQKKQSGKELTKSEIENLINGYVSGKVPDYQMSAFLMAVYFQGMSYDETFYLTEAMLNSGEKLDTSKITGAKIDKHSTGGVGDKVSIILAPLVASLGVTIPMISGRGLGHSGGTLDKLESIPGFQTNFKTNECLKLLEKTGVALIGQSENLVPADKKLYALRDSTSTVRSIPLITASILSKKLAEGIDSLVLDVKVGLGAFCKDKPYASKLTDSLISTGDKFTLNISALFTAMDQPLGKAIGNWLEIKESIETLKGEGPEDLTEVTLALGAEMLIHAKMDRNISSAIDKLKKTLHSGLAYKKFIEIVKKQGGKVKYIKNVNLYDKSSFKIAIPNERNGFVKSIDAFKLGTLAMELGAGRKTMEDEIDYKAGIVLHKKIGDYVERNETLADVFTDLNFSTDSIKERILDSIEITGNKVLKPNPILGYANKEGLFKWPY